MLGVVEVKSMLPGSLCASPCLLTWVALLHRAPMISPMAEALISFPVEIGLKDAVSATLETNWTTLCTMVLENRLMSVMRFQKGDVRSFTRIRPLLHTPSLQAISEMGPGLTWP